LAREVIMGIVVRVSVTAFGSLVVLAGAARAAETPGMVWVPSGPAHLGCVASDAACYPGEVPGREIRFMRGFFLDSSEVTVAQYRDYAKNANHTPASPPPFRQDDSHPVVGVSWQDAVDYCTWHGKRLPSEAEWEAAARGGVLAAIFPGGATLSGDQANLEGSSGRDRFPATAPVATFSANPLGLFDMAGNVWEWVADWYASDALQRASEADPHGPPTGTLRVLKGGAWNAPAKSARVSNRGRLAPEQRVDFVGFRCARDGEAPNVEPPAVKPVATPVATSPPVATPPPAAPAADEQPPVSSPPQQPASPPPAGPGAAPPVAAEPPRGTAAAQPPTGMVLLPAGSFEMGCVRGDGGCFADEQPRHEVVLTRDQWMDVTEVTFAQYKTFTAATGNPPPRLPSWAEDTHPVVNVTWEEAQAYCRSLGGRLPTEAEWERSARGGIAGQRFPWGDRVTHDDANFDQTGGRDIWLQSSPAGSFAPNAYGLYDLAGNAWEWVADWYDERAYAARIVDPQGPASGVARVVRGGCWTSDPGRLRSSYRFSVDPASSQVALGFRCVRDVPPQ
jgi:formylglycine-generating enzyme